LNLVQPLLRFFTRPVSRAIGLVFIADGLFYGSWSALIPYVKDKFSLDAAQLGLLLFCLPLGVTASNPLAAVLIRRYSLRYATLGSLGMASFCFLLPIIAPSVMWTAASLIFCGVFFSILNNTMNTCATVYEEQEHTRILSTCHGMWSFGAMMGSALAGMLTGLGMLPAVYMTLMLLLVAGIGLFASQPLAQIIESDRAEGQGSATFGWPTAALWGLIILSLCTNLTEGAMADWAAVYFREVLHTAPWLTGYGFAAYAFWMAAGRFAGDALLTKYNNRRILQAGGAIVTLGLLLSVLLPFTPIVLLGFALVGAGVSLGAPILYGSASRAPGMAPGAGLGIMNTFAMAGFLAGPTAIGFIAKSYGLPIAFTLVALAASFWSWKAGTAKGL